MSVLVSLLFVQFSVSLMCFLRIVLCVILVGFMWVSGFLFRVVLCLRCVVTDVCLSGLFVSLFVFLLGVPVGVPIGVLVVSCFVSCCAFWFAPRVLLVLFLVLRFVWF